MMPGITVSCLTFLLVLGYGERVYASEGFEDLVKLVKTGMAEKTFLGYVQVSPTAYNLTEEEIIYLSDLGLSADAIKAINGHGHAQEPVTAATEATVLEETPAEDVETSVPDTPGLETASEVPAREMVQEMDVTAPVVTAPPLDTADYSTFYDGLAPYGTWINLDGNWCWQPTASILHSDWRPYCHRGNWVYTDSGWAWRSSYSWGWAPFHYGRWRHHSRYGWLWNPGNVWGPAWVCWRYSNEVIGWAPLPPEAVFDPNRGLCVQGRAVDLNFDFALIPSFYTFVPVAHFFSSNVGNHRFRGDQSSRIFQSATIVGNRYRHQDNRVFNDGPPATHITAATHQVLRPLTIVDATLRAGDPIRRSTISPTTFTVYRPPVAATAQETPDQVVQRRQRLAEAHRESANRESIIRSYQNPSLISDQQRRGRTSLGTSTTVTVPAKVPKPDLRVQERNRPTMEASTHAQSLEAVARQRQIEEAAARQREEQQHQADQLIQHQNETRRLAQEQALAVKQQRAGEVARQLEERRRAEELSKQQDALRRQEETRRIRAATQQQAEQQQSLRAQRQAEEAAAHRQMELSRAQEAIRQRENQRTTAPLPTPSGTVQGYGNGRQATIDSQRGADSREATGGQGSTHRRYYP